MSRPVALDLFCGAGGATRGLQMAGFEVVGVDNRKQPRYCGEHFIQADALNPPVDLSRFDLIWASPPCQKFSLMTRRHVGRVETHPDHIPAVRDMLAATGAQTVIENTPTAPLRRDLVLTGEMFGLDTYRMRVFETNFFVLAPRPGKPFGPISRPGAETIVGHPGGHSRRDRRGERRMRGTLARWREIMGIEWMLGRELVEAIPPAYSQFIGHWALRHLGRLAA